jgi:hypothetical protein
MSPTHDPKFANLNNRLASLGVRRVLRMLRGHFRRSHVLRRDEDLERYAWLMFEELLEIGALTLLCCGMEVAAGDQPDAATTAEHASTLGARKVLSLLRAHFRAHKHTLRRTEDVQRYAWTLLEELLELGALALIDCGAAEQAELERLAHENRKRFALGLAREPTPAEKEADEVRAASTRQLLEREARIQAEQREAAERRERRERRRTKQLQEPATTPADTGDEQMYASQG